MHPPPPLPQQRCCPPRSPQQGLAGQLQLQLPCPLWARCGLAPWTARSWAVWQWQGERCRVGRWGAGWRLQRWGGRARRWQRRGACQGWWGCQGGRRGLGCEGGTLAQRLGLGRGRGRWVWQSEGPQGQIPGRWQPGTGPACAPGRVEGAQGAAGRACGGEEQELVRQRQSRREWVTWQQPLWAMLHCRYCYCCCCCCCCCCYCCYCCYCCCCCCCCGTPLPGRRRRRGSSRPPWGAPGAARAQ